MARGILRLEVTRTSPQVESRTASELLGSLGTLKGPDSPLLFDRVPRARCSRITRGPHSSWVEWGSVLPFWINTERGSNHRHTHLLDGVRPRRSIHQNRSLQHHFSRTQHRQRDAAERAGPGIVPLAPPVDKNSSRARDDQTRDARVRRRGGAAASWPRIACC